MNRAFIAIGAIALGACLSKDPSHCANRAGDATCSAELPFCSVCASVNAGCVQEEPSTDCWRPGAGAGSTSTTSATGTAETASATTEAAACNNVGLDDDCPLSRPYCNQGTCIPCAEGGPNFCDDACHPESGLCVGCVDSQDCGGDVCGDPYMCVSCTRHADCPDSACDLESGACFQAASVFWVDPTGCEDPGVPMDDPGFGTELDPYCWLNTALSNIDFEGTGVLRLADGATFTEPLAVSGAQNRIIAVVGGATLSAVPTAVAVSDSSTLYLGGVTVTGAVTGVQCAGGSTLWITDAEVRGNRFGIDADGCPSVNIDRTLVEGSEADAVAIRNGALKLRSSALLRNGDSGSDATALRSTGSEILVTYTTIAGNRSSTDHASIFCGSTTGAIRNSVMASFDSPSVDCGSVDPTSSVVDTDFPNATVVNTFEAAWFVDYASNDVSVADPDNSPFRDVALFAEGDPLRDFGGSRRLAYPGLPEFAGARQP